MVNPKIVTIPNSLYWDQSPAVSQGLHSGVILCLDMFSLIRIVQRANDLVMYIWSGCVCIYIYQFTLVCIYHVRFDRLTDNYEE